MSMTETTAELAPPDPEDHLVILVQGISTRARWMGEIKPALESAGFAVAPTSYGKYGLHRFLSPFVGSRKKAIERVADDIKTARRAYKLATGAEPTKMSLISHSFGTYVAGRIMLDYPEYDWERVIFCGSVVRDDFPFNRVILATYWRLRASHVQHRDTIRRELGM
ncbi:pimeloyl-ACP methyl ester carboxylesterase [Bradyrhizobium sp. USDA 4449]